MRVQKSWDTVALLNHDPPYLFLYLRSLNHVEKLVFSFHMLCYDLQPAFSFHSCPRYLSLLVSSKSMSKNMSISLAYGM